MSCSPGSSTTTPLARDDWVRLRNRLPSLPDGRAFRAILAATIVSQLGDWSGRLAAALIVAERSGGSPLAVGAVGLVLAAPHVGPGQLVTAYLERFGRRPVLVGCDSLRMVAFLALAFLPLDTVPFLLVLAVAAMADQPFEATASAAIVEIVRPDEVDEAIRIRQLTRQVTTMIGLGVGGLLAAWTSAAFVLGFDAFTFAVSALLIRSVRGTLAHRPATTSSVRTVIADGVKFLASDRVSRRAVLATLVVVVAGMAVEGQVTVLGPELVGAGPSAIGLMAMAAPAGTLVAVALQGKRAGDDAMARAVVVSLFAAVIAIASFEVGGSVPVLVVAFFAVGVMYQLSVTANVIVAQRVPAARRATTFGLVQGVVGAAHGLGAWLGGIGIELIGPQRGAQIALGATSVLVLLAPHLRREG